MPGLHACLEFREAGDFSLKCNDFTVYGEAFCLLASERGDQLWVLIIEPLLIAGQELDIGSGPQGKTALSIQVGFKYLPSREKGSARVASIGRSHFG
jgi:hypothetical protein